jgi:hypothetical protein
MIVPLATVAAIGVGLAWLGAAVVVLAHGRRGLALGLVVTGAGLAVVAFAAGRELVAGFLFVGGAATALLRLRDGQPGWGLAPAGSTPRLVLCLLILVALPLLDASLHGTSPSLLATLAVSCLAAARLLTTGIRAAALASAATMALGLAGMGSLPVAIAAAAVSGILGAITASGQAETAR